MPFFNKQNFSYVSPALKEQEIPGFGMGMFTTTPIKKDELLAIFGGHVMSVGEELKLTPPLNDYSIQIHQNFVIGPISMDEVRSAEYFNHSCEPNCGINGQIFLVAMRDIETNEEITFDYAMVLTESNERETNFSIKCVCNKPNCRGIITDKDWRLAELQSKYKGYFSWHIKEKIDKAN